MQIDLANAARLLVEARLAGRRLVLPEAARPRDIAEAEDLQDEVVRQLRSPVVGWKVNELPDGMGLFAPILAAGVVPEGGTWRAPGPEQAGIELEVAFRMARDVPPDATPDAILDCVASCNVVYELCQSRLVDPASQPRHVSLADCISNWGLVIGGDMPGWRTTDLKARPGRLLVDGKVAMEGKSVDPVRMLQLLVPSLARRGKRLSAGQTVITGSVFGMSWQTGRRALEGRIDGFPPVKLTLEAAG